MTLQPTVTRPPLGACGAGRARTSG